MSASKGLLTLNVLEASGESKEGAYVWDPASFKAWVKVELRGGPAPVKVQTTSASLSGHSLIWHQPLQLEVVEGAKELRLMLCKDKISAEGRRGVSVIAACGIYVDQILENVPIDKSFELFKPNGGGDGGFIRIGIDFVPSGKAASAVAPASLVGAAPPAQTATKSIETGAVANGAAAAPASTEKPSSSTKQSTPSKKSSPLPTLAVPLLVAVVGVIGFVVFGKKSNKKRD